MPLTQKWNCTELRTLLTVGSNPIRGAISQIYRFIVQRQERLALNQSNLGSNPSEPTIMEERRSFGGRYAPVVNT